MERGEGQAGLVEGQMLLGVAFASGSMSRDPRTKFGKILWMNSEDEAAEADYAVKRPRIQEATRSFLDDDASDEAEIEKTLQKLLSMLKYYRYTITGKERKATSIQPRKCVPKVV